MAGMPAGDAVRVARRRSNWMMAGRSFAGLFTMTRRASFLFHILYTVYELFTCVTTDIRNKNKTRRCGALHNTHHAVQ